MSFITDLADDLARDTLKVMDATGQDRLYVEVAEVLAAASTTMEEEYLTCIRVRLAERRGRAFLTKLAKEARSRAVDGTDAPET
ncbi:hypothetical protein FIU97_08280 [Roseivivax sp. THAF40]|uniref:hypothetical protein n=1 Tax=unclassified Roseivivax TaxID=2639302 RepID=UPI001268B5A2|nr:MULTISPECIES: hypothetical protein [unclassified Roseivivax]QFS82795.1 hypothetical protein FIV09_08175 [Roseivivax sp. THAF197b]QFT46564.1 hypothetical protein FIU97_08280 [Roseivivax sp. THAF40]